MESEASHSMQHTNESETPNTDDFETSDHIVDGGSSRKRTRETSTQKPPVAPKRKSPFWEHCEKGTRTMVDGSIQPIGICNYCKTEIPAATDSTSGLKNHLMKRCKLSPLYELGSEKGQTVLTNEVMGQANHMIAHTFNQKRCELRLTEYVIRDETSFRAVEGKVFVNLVHELQPRFKIPDRKEVAGMVYALFLAEKSKIQSVISSQRVSITTDTWTSIQNINYMVVTTHFLDSDWKLHKRIINFTKITSHVGEEIGKMIEVCLREWRIENVFSIVVDNASSNDTAIDYLKRRMKIENTLLFDGKYLHLRCACHILNLIVKDGLKELNSSIKSVRNAVVFIHSSPSRLNKFREFDVLAKFSSTSTVPMDVKTRWNATYKMLEVALKYRRVFERMGEEWLPFIRYFQEKDDIKGTKRVGPPSAYDWENAQAFVHFLKKFYDATLELSASKSPTSQLIYQSMIALQIEIEKRSKFDSDPALQKVASVMKEKFDKYWGDWRKINPLIFISNVLDPRNKLQMIKVCVKKLGGTPDESKYMIDQVKKNLITLWMEYKGENDSSASGKQNVRMECAYEDDATDGSGLYDELFSDVEAQNEEEQLQEISNEVDKYLADDIEKRSNSSFNLLEWWKGSETRYPILSLLAKDIFAIPSSTVASESAFSLGKRIVDPFRSSLSPKMVEALVCTNDWLKAEDFSFYKDPTDDDLELYKEIEEIEKNATISHTFSPSSSLTTM